jgi:hypothetical protein
MKKGIYRRLMKDLADLIELRHGLPTILNTPSAKISIERSN